MSMRSFSFTPEWNLFNLFLYSGEKIKKYFFTVNRIVMVHRIESRFLVIIFFNYLNLSSAMSSS